MPALIDEKPLPLGDPIEPAVVAPPNGLLWEADPETLYHSVFDRLTGYHCVTAPAGTYNRQGRTEPSGGRVEVFDRGLRSFRLPNRAQDGKNLRVWLDGQEQLEWNGQSNDWAEKGASGTWRRGTGATRLMVWVRGKLGLQTRIEVEWDGEAGEGDPARFFILEHKGALPEQRRQLLLSPDEGLTLQKVLIVTRKLDVDALLQTAKATFQEDHRLDNVFSLDALAPEESAVLWREGNDLDRAAQLASFDTKQNSTLTVGTGKTYLSYAAAYAAANSGDALCFYATMYGYDATATDTYVTGTSTVTKLNVDTYLSHLITSVGQTITASASFSSNRIGVNLARAGTPGGVVTVTVRRGATMGSGDILFSASVDASTVGTGSGTIQFCDGDAAANFTLGEVYHFEVTATGGTYDGSNYVQVYRNAAGGYTGGNGHKYTAEDGWVSVGTDDFAFYVYTFLPNAYTENFALGKQCSFTGMVANQGINIPHRTGNALSVGTNTFMCGLFQDFTCTALANSLTSVGANGSASAELRNLRVIGPGASGTGLYLYTTPARCTNILVRGYNIGIQSIGGATNPVRHVTAVKNNTGITSNTAPNGAAQYCLAAGNTTADFGAPTEWVTNGSFCNVSGDASAPGAGSVTGLDTNDFTDFANNDFSLKASVKDTTKARFLGYTTLRQDIAANIRQANGVVYAGCYDGNPGLVPDVTDVLDVASGGPAAYGLDLEKVGTATTGAPAGTFDVRLSASKVANGSSLTVTGGVTLSQNATGVAVKLRRYRKADDVEITPAPVDVSADFTAGVQKTWATLLRAAVTLLAGTTAREEYLVASISAGTPAVTAEESKQYLFAVIPAFNTTGPGLVVHDGGNGSVTIDVSNNLQTDGATAQVSRLKYRKASDSSWTVFGSSFSGNGLAQTGPTGLDKGNSAEAYTFQLIPYDSVTGLEGVASKPYPLHLADSTAAATTSDLDDEMAASCSEALDELGRDVTFTGYGLSPVVTAAVVSLTNTQTMELDGKQEVILSGTIALPATVATNPDRRDTFAIDGKDYGCEAPPHPPAGGWVIYPVKRLVRVMQGAGKTRG